MIVKRGEGDFPRVYRPRRMSEVYGLKSIVDTISHSLDKGNLPNALLFIGPTGSGKTTISRIIGMGLLCEQGPTSSPCCECETCKSIIARGWDLGYQEYSAVELSTKKTFFNFYHQIGAVPEKRKRKIVVINECEAFKDERKLLLGSTFLDKKSGYYLILCSGEPKSVGKDLRESRKTFDLEKMNPSDLEELLYDVCKTEKIKPDKETIDSIIRRSKSNPRQALILLKNPELLQTVEDKRTKRRRRIRNLRPADVVPPQSEDTEPSDASQALTATETQSALVPTTQATESNAVIEASIENEGPEANEGKMEIIPVERLEAEIAACKDFGKLKEIKDKAEALRVFFRKAKIGFEIANQYSELKIRAERRCGEILAFEIEHGGDRKSKSRFSHRTLKDLGINKNQSRYWQAVAELPEDLFEEHLAQIREAKKELTSACVYRRAFEFRRAKEADRAPIPGADSINTPIRIRTICGDFMDHIDDFKNVDAIITDPPYKKKYLPLYENLARFAAQVLKPGGSLLAMADPQHLPAVLALMTPHLTYHWAISYYTPGASRRVKNLKVMGAWKLVLWFVKGKYEGKWVSDVCRSDAPEKEYDQWQQSESGTAELVEKFTQPREMIIDPMFGSGTTGVVAIKLNRQCIGIEIDPKKMEKAEKRLKRVAMKVVLPSYYPDKIPAEILDNWEKQGNNGDSAAIETIPTCQSNEQNIVQEKPFEINGWEQIPNEEPGRYVFKLKERKPDEPNVADASDTGSVHEELPN